jgi:hypothetical protein
MKFSIAAIFLAASSLATAYTVADLPGCSVRTDPSLFHAAIPILESDHIANHDYKLDTLLHNSNCTNNMLGF